MEYAEAFFSARDKATPSCEVKLDPSDYAGWRTALKLSWYKNTSFSLPNFKGSLTARPLFMGSELTLTGSYGWPLVEKNASLDKIALAIARAAARSLLQQIALHCEAEWIAFASGCPTIAMCNERSAASAPLGRTAS